MENIYKFLNEAEASTDARPTKRARKRSSKVSTAAADIDIEGDVVSEKDEEWIPGSGKQLKIGRKKKQEGCRLMN